MSNNVFVSAIDCGKDGYKTTREIELEKKLKIAVKALKIYADKTNWSARPQR